jgi:non-ribosomal peptide synthetase component F
MLAVLKAGGAFVPLDPSHPVERLRGLCESVKAKLVLCAEHLVEKLAGVVDIVLPVHDRTLAECAAANLESTVSCTNPAYVIFTSGSTGKPKVSFQTMTLPLFEGRDVHLHSQTGHRH